jgi:aryl-alcohol dehydrogenase-like predicted oxidoreductase
MGLLSGRYTRDSRLAAEDVRGGHMAWVRFFREGRPAPEFIRQRDAIRDLLASGGRSVVQGALAYLWAKSAVSIPIPGFRTVAQAVENAGAMAFGPLEVETVTAIEARLAALAESERETQAEATS